jgi:hypothetical protein
MTFKYGDRVKGQNTGRIGTFVKYLPAKEQAQVYWTNEGPHGSFPLGLQALSSRGLDLYSSATCQPKFTPGQRVKGLVSGSIATVIGPKYEGHGRWWYDIEYDAPKPHMDKVAEAVETNLELLDPEPEPFKVGDHVRLTYSRRIARLEHPESGEPGSWKVTIVRDEDGSVQDYSSYQSEEIMTLVPKPEDPKPDTAAKFNEAVAVTVVAERKAREALDVLKAAEQTLRDAQNVYRDARREADNAYEAVRQAMADHVYAQVDDQ